MAAKDLDELSPGQPGKLGKRGCDIISVGTCRRVGLHCPVLHLPHWDMRLAGLGIKKRERRVIGAMSALWLAINLEFKFGGRYEINEATAPSMAGDSPVDAYL